MPVIRSKATLDSKPFESKLGRMKGGVSKFAAGFGKVKGGALAAIAAVVALGAAVGKLVSFGSEMTDMAAQTGVSVDALQKLQVAVRLAGGENQQLVNSLTRLRDSQGAVISGDKTLEKAFKTLGISIDEVAGMDIEQLFIAISKSLTDSGNEATKFAAVVDIIGARNAPKLIEAMNLAAEGFDKFDSSTKTLSQDTAEQLDAMSDAWGEFVNNVKVRLAEALVATINFFKTDKQLARDKAEFDARQAKKAQQDEVVRQQKLLNLKKRREEEEAEKKKKNQEKLESAKTSVSAPSIISDAIRRAGGRVGTDPGRALRVAQMQLQIAKKQADILAQIERNTKKKEEGGLAA